MDDILQCAVDGQLDLHPLGWWLASHSCQRCHWNFSSLMRLSIAMHLLNGEGSHWKNLMHGAIWWKVGCAEAGRPLGQLGWSLLELSLPMIYEVVQRREKVKTCCDGETAWVALLQDGASYPNEDPSGLRVPVGGNPQMELMWASTLEEMAHGLGHALFSATHQRASSTSKARSLPSSMLLVRSTRDSLAMCKQVPKEIEDAAAAVMKSPDSRSGWTAWNLPENCACGAFHGFYNSFDRHFNYSFGRRGAKSTMARLSDSCKGLLSEANISHKEWSGLDLFQLCHDCGVVNFKQWHRYGPNP